MRPVSDELQKFHIHVEIPYLCIHKSDCTEDSGLHRSAALQYKRLDVLDSIADLSFVVCCAIQLLPTMSIPAWLWIWTGIIVIIKIVNQISSFIIIKRFCFPHTIANKLTGFLLFLQSRQSTGASFPLQL